MTEETHENLKRAQNLEPDDDLNAIWAKAIAMLVERPMATKRRTLKQTARRAERSTKATDVTHGSERASQTSENRADGQLSATARVRLW